MVAQCEPRIDWTVFEEAPVDSSTECRIAHNVIRRLAGDPAFVGAALALCEGVHGVDEETLADYLGCSLRGLTRLALMRAPRPGTREFAAEVRRLATATGADGDQLGLMLELADRCRACGIHSLGGIDR